MSLQIFPKFSGFTVRLLHLYVRCLTWPSFTKPSVIEVLGSLVQKWLAITNPHSNASVNLLSVFQCFRQEWKGKDRKVVFKAKHSPLVTTGQETKYPKNLPPNPREIQYFPKDLILKVSQFNSQLNYFCMVMKESTKMSGRNKIFYYILQYSLKILHQKK